MLPTPYSCLWASRTWDPYWWMGFLYGYYPGVHDPEVVMFTFPAKWAGGGPGFDDEVVTFFKPLPVGYRVRVVGPAFHSDAPDETGDDSASGQNVQHRNFFS